MGLLERRLASGRAQAAPPRKVDQSAAASSGGGAKDEAGAFLRKYIFGKDAEGKSHSEFGERASMRGTVAKAIESRIEAVRQTDPALADQMAQHLDFRDLQGLPGRDEPYKVFLHPKAASLEGAAERISRSGVPVSPQELAAAAAATYGGNEEAAVARMLLEGQVNQSVSEPHIQGMLNGGRRLAAGLGEQLIADNPDPRALQVLGIDEGVLRQRWGAQPVTDAAGTAAPAAASTAEPAVTDAAAAAVTGGTAEVPVGIQSNFPSWVPRHPGLSDLESAMAYGGLGLGGAALAGYLMSQGQAQASPNDYAAAAAAMNAYA